MTAEEKLARAKELGFVTDEGLVEEFHGTVEKSYFDFNEKYQNGSILMLYWDCRNHENGEIVTLQFPCGKDWDKDDPDGARAVHGKNPKANFQRNSAVGILLTLAMMGEDETHKSGLHGLDLVDHLCELAQPPQVAAIWEGLAFEFKRVEFDFGTRKVKDAYGEETETEMKSERVFPILVLRDGEEAAEKPKPKAEPAASKVKPAATATAKKAKATTKAEAPAEKSKAELLKEQAAARKAAKEAAASAPESSRGPLMTEIGAQFPELVAFIDETFAAASGDHDTFMDAAIENATIAGNDDLIGYVGDPDQLFAELLDEAGGGG